MQLAKTKNMKIEIIRFLIELSWWQILIIALAFALGFLLFCPFKLSAKAYANILTLTSFFGVYLFEKIGLFFGKISFEREGVYFTNKKGLSKRIYIKLPNKKQRHKGDNMLSVLREKRLRICFHGGVEEDEYRTALLCGSVISGAAAVSGFINEEYQAAISTNVLKTSKEDLLAVTLEFYSITSVAKLISGLLKK